MDPYTAQVDVVSDPLPHILKGIRLRIRGVRVVLQRPHFTLNPTSCQPKNVAASLSSTQGTKARVASPFKVVGCSRLPFKPSVTIGLSGAGRTHSGDHPTLTINGGPESILVITGGHLDICRKPQTAHAELGGHNGKSKSQTVTMRTPCGKSAAS